MPLIISDTAKGLSSTPTGERAGETLNIELPLVIKANSTLAAATIVELGYLPAYHQLVGGHLITDALGAGITATVGFMSGEVAENNDARTSGNELFNAADVAAAAALPLNSVTALRLPSERAHRPIGIKFSGAVANATGNDKVVTLSLLYAQAGDRNAK